MKNDMPAPLKKEPLKNILEKWLCHAIDEREVLDLAGEIETRYHARESRPDYSRDQIESIFEEVLYKLDGLHYQLVIHTDIPAMMAFLETDPAHCQQGWAQWETYWQTVDFEQRKSELKGNPLYITGD